ncbi:hypothetical protein D9611_000817 [Ephemerocybe angulata]|uniref:BAR-domain-containing protein n=1 Tax=Ephemerocybe angulata TaxID=980116 RepID=A0A8H5BN43_9AGAR|nr:hypothetical protein D9611_000817 [Tulosesus angulatus]
MLYLLYHMCFRCLPWLSPQHPGLLGSLHPCAHHCADLDPNSNPGPFRHRPCHIEILTSTETALDRDFPPYRQSQCNVPMSSKPLGKLRQWAGEVISTSKDKTTVTDELDEFAELERDIDLRKDGAIRLYGACEAYQQSLSKKKVSEAAGDSDKLLPIDALGMVMISHGEQFPEDSRFGSSLVRLGRAHCSIATLQQTYAVQFKDTFMAAIERFLEEIKEYEALRKQLESRRGVLDSATAKFEKTLNSKKDKDKDKLREAEDEMERAQQRYDETIEDMRAHMHALQENEVAQERELSAFLDLEINFVQQHLQILKDVRDDWPDNSSRSSDPSNMSNQRTNASTTPMLPRRAISTPVVQPLSLDSSDDENYRPPSRGSFRKHKKSESSGSRGPSRPSSRLSRRRTNSSAASSSDKNGKEEKEENKPRRLSVAGWASNAVDNLANRSKKNKDKEAFSTLGDDGADIDSPNVDEDARQPNARRGSFSLKGKVSSRKKSKEALASVAPAPLAPPRILKPRSLQDKKTVKALYDFNGSADELTFRAGTDIKVLNEVVDGWWMGEIDGKKGLFPTSYVSNSPKVSPELPPRPYRPDEGIQATEGDGPSQYASAPPHLDDGNLTSDLEDEYGLQPLTHNRSPFYGGAFNDVMSDQHEETDNESPKATAAPRRFSDDMDVFLGASQSKMTPKMRSVLLRDDDHHGDTANQPLLRSQSEGPPSPTTGTSVTPKKAPPPPPPRRPMHSAHSTPAIPARKLGPSPPSIPPRPSTTSSTESMQSFLNNSQSSLSAGHGDDGRGLDYDISPFESAAELPPQGVASNSRGCGRFHPNPFYPKGMCSNCKTYHS